MTSGPFVLDSTRTQPPCVAPSHRFPAAQLSATRRALHADLAGAATEAKFAYAANG